MINWNPNTWQNSKIKTQMPFYDNLKKLNSIKAELKTNDGFINLSEIILLKEKLKLIPEENNFLITAGDCAESFNSKPEDIIKTIKLIEEMSKIITGNVIKVARLAGQYAKPRTTDFETINGITLPIYRGDIINSIKFTKEKRTPKPELMRIAYRKSLETIKILKENSSDFYTAHESLLLDYEECFIRYKDDITYLSSTAFPWVGDRTKNSNSSHIEFLRGVINPISIKCGATTDLFDLIKAIKILNPTNEMGKINLTIRAGVNNIKKFLENLIEIIKENNLNVIFTIDPMHGNTKKIGNFKVRYLIDIKQEISSFFEISRKNGIYPAGIHLEMTGAEVTECIGCSTNEKNISQNYKTLCDPRLNREQSLNLIEFIKGLR